MTSLAVARHILRHPVKVTTAGKPPITQSVFHWLFDEDRKSIRPIDEIPQPVWDYLNYRMSYIKAIRTVAPGLKLTLAIEFMVQYLLPFIPNIEEWTKKLMETELTFEDKTTAFRNAALARSFIGFLASRHPNSYQRIIDENQKYLTFSGSGMLRVYGTGTDLGEKLPKDFAQLTADLYARRDTPCCFPSCCSSILFCLPFCSNSQPTTGGSELQHLARDSGPHPSYETIRMSNIP